MLRHGDDWDGQHFAFRPGGAPQDAARTVASVHEGPSGPTVTIPDAHFLFNAEFKRAGSDLILSSDHGKTTVVHDYFASGQRATLLSRDGAAIAPDVVEALAGPLAPGQYAQAGAAQQNVQAIGRVAKVDGNATILRNGVAINVRVGDAILKGDVLQTGSGALGVTFNDGSTVNLTENARLVVNEFIFDPKGNANSQILDLVQGSLTFISGEVAHSGDMKIGTPVATMGIRGTVGGVTNASDGTVHFYVSQSATGAVIVDQSGNVIANVVQDGPLIVVRPVGPLQVLAEEVQKSPAELAAELAALQHIVSVQAIGQQIIQQFFNPNQDQNPQSNGTDHTQIQIDIPKSTILPDNPNGDGNGNNNGGNNATVTITTTNDNPNNNTPGETQQFTVEIPDNLAPVIFTPFASAFVSEEGLAKGIADSVGNTDSTDAVVAQGTIDAGDANGDPLTFTLGAPATALTSNGVPVTWTGAGTSTLVGKAGTDTVITVAIGAHTGTYTVTLAGPVDHPDTTLEDIISFNVPVNVSDGQATKTALLALTIEDDRPFAASYQEDVSAGVAAAKSVDVVVILDVSGSMGGNNITLAKQALDNLLTTNNVQINQVMAVSFASSATVHQDHGSVWTDAASANTFILGLVAGGGTNYQAALAAVMDNWGGGPSGADETLIYFISDGVPSSPLTAGQTTDWENFLADKGVDVSYAIGISTNVDDPDLAPIAWTPDDADFSPIVLSDPIGLDDTLQGTVSGQMHNIFADDASVGLGGDGGHILSVDVDGVTYTWDGLNTITKSGLATGVLAASMFAVDTVLGGHLEFHFADSSGHQAGDWSYLQPDQVAQLTDEVFHYALIDNDGDTSGADITVSVSAANFAPVIDAHNLVATSPLNSNDTTVTDIAVSDIDVGNELLTLTAMIDNGTLTFLGNELDPLAGNGTDSLSASGTLADINDAFTTGMVYSPTLNDPNDPNSLPDTDKIALTVTDNHGASDTVTFVFSVADQPNGTVILTGTTGKDYIYATGYNDTLTGNGDSDTFVFFAADIGGSSHVTDFSLFDDFLQFDQELFPGQTVADLLSGASVQDIGGSTVFTTDGGAATITVNNVSLTDLVQHQDHVLIV